MILDKIKSFFSSEVQIKPSPEITAEIKQAYSNHRELGAQPYACYAPLKNMYFGHHGNVAACCYNRSHILGNYPTQTVKDIWFGGKADELRRSLKAYNFSMGCQECMKQLVAGNFDGSKAKQFDTQRMNENKFPSLMEFELENTCNLECIMCSGDYSSLIRTKREGRAELPKPYDDEFIRQLEEFIPHLEATTFYGGEPFLIPVYYKIWDKIIELNPAVRISVQTNGTTLNNRVKEILQKTNFQINVSLDSLNKERYEDIRRNSHFETVMSNLNYFHSYCRERNTFFGVSVCLMQQNWFEAPDFIRFCNELDAPVYFHTVITPDYASLKQLSSEKLLEIYGLLEKELHGFPEDTAVRKKNKKHYHDFILQLLEWSKKADINPETYDIKSVEQLKAFLFKKTLERKDIGEEEKKISLEKIGKKMDVLSTILPAGIDIQGLIKDVNTRDKAAMIGYLQNAENGPAEQAAQYLHWWSGAWMKDKPGKPNG